METHSKRTGKQLLIETSIFCVLPWISLLFSEFFLHQSIRAYQVDGGMISLLTRAAGVYVYLALLCAILATASPVVSAFFSRTDSPPAFAMAMAGVLTPFSFVAIHLFGRYLDRYSPWLTIPVLLLLAACVGSVALLLIAHLLGSARSNALGPGIAILGILAFMMLLKHPIQRNLQEVDSSMLLATSLAQLGIVMRHMGPWSQVSAARLARRAAVPVSLVLGVYAIASGRAPEVAAAHPAPDVGSTPNVVVLLVDTVRPDHLSLYGYGRDTSIDLEGEAGPGSTLFTNATAQATATVPSVKSLFTSRAASSWGFSGWRRSPPLGEWTLPAAFQRAGFQTAGFSANGLINGAGFESGFEEFFSWSGLGLALQSTALTLFLGRGDDIRVFDLVRKWRAHYPPGEIITELADRWLREKKSRPFFLYVHLLDPHWPFYSHGLGMIPEEYAGRDNELYYTKLLGVQSKAEAAAFRASPGFGNLIGRYDEELRRSDALIMQLIATLRELEQWDQTIFLVLADHGEEFFEHGRFSHGHDVWEELSRVPMFVKWPKDTAFSGMPQVVNERVGLIDVAPTLVDYLDLPGPRTAIAGLSLRPLLEGHTENLERPLFSEAVAGRNTFRAAYWEENIKVRLEYSRSTSPAATSAVEVYDLHNDPGETQPLEDDDRRVLDVVGRARRFLTEGWTTWPDRMDEQSTDETDTRTDAVEQLRALGYVR